MKMWLLAGLVALCVGYFDLLPFESVDAGELYIVETLMVEETAGGVRLWAGEVQGRGDTLRDAAADMENRAPGRLFLRQTKRLIFCGEAEVRPMELPETLPMGATVYRAEESAEELLEEKTLEDVLEARERRMITSMPTLADLKNEALTKKPLTLADLDWEGEAE